MSVVHRPPGQPATFALFALTALAALTPLAVEAQPTAAAAGGKTLELRRTPTRPVIDGRIDEQEWAAAVTFEDLHQTEPIEYAAPSERTRVYVMFDADTLYVAAKNWDSEPDRVAANILLQGAELNDDDNFGVTLDTFNDQRNGYWFEVNPNGVRRQAIFQNTSDRNFDWRGIWDAMAQLDVDGWSAEMAIPLKTLSFDPASDTWGINFRRKIERKQEFIGWVSRNQQVNPGAAGTATGLTDLSVGVGLDVVPSISVRHSRDYSTPEGSDDQSIEPSLDAFYKITPALTAALTINTDFSATEVDDREVNLTRFDLFFPEKRAFFLQDADIFEFGRLTSESTDSELSGSTFENGRPFFSRRIGLSADGEPVDLRVGGKLTGRVGNWNVGLLDVQQAAYGGVDSRNLLVGRAVANVLEESSLGMILTNGDPRSNADNTLVGADFRYQNTRLPGDWTLRGEAWFQQSDTEGVDGDDAAYGVRLATPNESGLAAALGIKELQANFNPALGFVNNVGIRDQVFESRYTWRREGLLPVIAVTLDAQRIELLDAGLQSQAVIARPLVFEMSTGDQVDLSYIASKERLYEPFEISAGVVLPAGDYSFDEYKLGVETGRHRVVSASARLAHGDFYSGTRWNIEGDVTWRPSRHFALRGEYEYFDVQLPEGHFVTRLLQARVDVVFSSRLAWSTLFQYDNDSEVAGFDSRVQWIPQAGRETYLVFNHALADPERDNRFRSQNAEAVLKVGYTFRF